MLLPTSTSFEYVPFTHWDECPWEIAIISAGRLALPHPPGIIPSSNIWALKLMLSCLWSILFLVLLSKTVLKAEFQITETLRYLQHLLEILASEDITLVQCYRSLGNSWLERLMQGCHGGEAHLVALLVVTRGEDMLLFSSGEGRAAAGWGCWEFCTVQSPSGISRSPAWWDPKADAE